MKISGNVIPTPNKLRSSIGRLRISKTKFSLNNLLNTDIINDEIELHNTYKEEIQVKFLDDLPYLKITPDIFNLKPDERISLNYIFSAAEKQDYGNFMEKVPLTFEDGSTSQKGYIYFTGQIKEDFSYLTPEDKIVSPILQIDTYVIDLGQIDLQEEILVNVPLTNEGKTDLLIRKIETSRYCNLIDFDGSIQPGQKGNISLEIFPQINRKNFNTDFTIICNDPEKPVVKIRISGLIK